MTNIVNILDQRLKNMRDEDLFREAVRCGRLMERGSLTRVEKEWSGKVFTAAHHRAATSDFKEQCSLALRLLRFF